jgi:predicted secreted protein
MEGPFQIAAIDYAGTFDGEATFEVSLASAGALAFSPLGAP